MHSIEASIVLFITFLCIVFLLQSTITLHSLIKERSEKEYSRELKSHSLGIVHSFLFRCRRSLSPKKRGRRATFANKIKPSALEIPIEERKCHVPKFSTNRKRSESQLSLSP